MEQIMKLLKQIDNKTGYMSFTTIFMNEGFLDFTIDIAKVVDNKPTIDGARPCKGVYKKTFRTDKNVENLLQEIVSDLENILANI